MDRNETRADIVGEMRGEVLGDDGVFFSMDGRRVMEFADRIEAAAKREAPFRYTAKLIGSVHKMRGAFEKILAIEGYGAPWIEAKTIAQKALEIALPDRRYAQNPESLSNTAKIREALEGIIDALNEARTEGRIEHWEYSNLFDIADAALSAPPRNCDRFATAEEAIAAHKQAETNCPPADCPECPYIHGRKSGVDCLTAWIFAPAAQEGGGNHESK